MMVNLAFRKDENMEEKILEIAAEIFRVPVSDLNINIGREDIEKWKSLQHVALVATLEEQLDIVVPFEEIANIKTLQDFLNFTT
jgi:acyl carrier protein